MQVWRTVTASTIIAHLERWAQGQTSQVGCGNSCAGRRKSRKTTRRGTHRVFDVGENQKPGPTAMFPHFPHVLPRNCVHRTSSQIHLSIRVTCSNERNL